MVALKSSGVWLALGDGAGGYSDTLGNPFPPFAYNSGYDVDEITREDAVALGLMSEDDEVQPAKTDFEDLIGAITAKHVGGVKPLHAEEAGHYEAVT